MNRFEGPGPGQPVSRQDLREVAQGLSDVDDQYGMVGVGVDRTQSTPVLKVPQAQRVNARILSGTNPYVWEGVVPDDPSSNTWVQDGLYNGDTHVSPLYTRNGSDQLKAGDIVEAWLLDDFGIWICDGPSEELFRANLNRRMLIDSVYEYAWTPPGDDSDTDSGKTGALPADPQIVHTQTADGLNPDIHTLTLVGATGGTFTLTDSGGSPTTAIAYNASHSTVQGLLTNFTVTGSGTVADPYVFTGTDASSHTLTIDGTDLTPTSPNSAAQFLNGDVGMAVPVIVWLKLTSGTPPSVDLATFQNADSSSKPMIFQFTLKDVTSGFFTGKFDGGTASAPIQWNASASDIETALTSLLACTVTGTTPGPFKVTVTADNSTHTFAIDNSGLIGDAEYFVAWSNGNLCTAAIGGCEPTLMPGYTGPPAQSTITVSVSPTGSSVGPWTISFANAASGNYQVVVDGGSPVSTAYGTAPSLSGLTVTTNPDGSYHVAGDGTTSHTITVFGAQLRNTFVPDQVVVILGSTGCVKLEPIGDCS